MPKLERKIDRSKTQTEYKPWLDVNGYPLSTELLEIASRKWTGDVWEKYLQSLETQQKEILTKDFSSKLEQFDKIESLSSQNDDPDEEIDLAALKEHLERLPLKERLVVRTLFFDGLGERDTGELLQMSRKAVRNHKKRAFRRLRARLSSTAVYLEPDFGRNIVDFRNNFEAFHISAAV